MKVNIQQLIVLSVKYKLRIVIEKDCVSFIYNSRSLDFYDIILAKITIHDLEICIRKMIRGYTNEEDQQETEIEAQTDENPSED